MSTCDSFTNCQDCYRNKCIWGISFHGEVQCAEKKSDFVFPRLFQYIDGCDDRSYYVPTSVWIFAGVGWVIAALFLVITIMVVVWWRLRMREYSRFGTATGAQPFMKPKDTPPSSPQLSLPSTSVASGDQVASSSSSFYKNPLFNNAGVGGREKYLHKRTTNTDQRREGSAPPDIAVASVHKNFKSRFEQTVLCMETTIADVVDEEEETIYEQPTASVNAAPAPRWYQRGYQRVSRVMTRKYAAQNNIKIA